jgi:hypothetical protein
VAVNTDIRSTEEFQQAVNQLADEMMTVADELANLAISLHPRLVQTLRAKGLDQARVAGFGSTAEQAAKSVTRHLRIAAESVAFGAKGTKKSYLEYVKNIVEPIKAIASSRQEFKV